MLTVPATLRRKAMKKIQLCLLLLTALFATGCPNEPSKNLKDAPLVNNINDYLADVERKCECYAISQDASFDSGSKRWSCSGTMTDGPAKAKILRNEALDK